MGNKMQVFTRDMSDIPITWGDVEFFFFFFRSDRCN